MPNSIADNLQRLSNAREDIHDAIVAKGGTSSLTSGFEDFADEIESIPSGPEPVLISKNINTNGTYEAEDDEADGYSEVVVNVPNTYAADDAGKVVQNGALVSQTSSSTSSNGTVNTTTISSLTISVPTYSSADNGKVIKNGALTTQSTHKSITANGTGIDTTYYSSVDVAVPDTYSQLFVTTDAGVTITVSKSGTTLPAQTSSSGEELVFNIPSSGTWTVSGSNSQSDTITINSKGAYYIEIIAPHIYGVSWDKSSSTVLTRTDEAVSFSNPSPALSGGNGSSPFDTLMPWSGMVKETIDENVMVKIPKFWYKITNDSSSLKIQISDKAQKGFSVSPAHSDRGDGTGERDYVYIGRYKCSSTDYKSQTDKSPKVSITRATARTSIHNLGSKYWQQDFAMFWTIRLLYIVEFANWNSQTVIGYGCGNNSSVVNTGGTDSMTYHTGTMQSSRTTYGNGTQYRWIEGLWDNVLEWVDGIRFSSSSIYVIKNPSSFSDSSGGTNIGSRTTSSGCIKAWSVPTASGYDWAMYPNAVVSDSSYSTYVADDCSYASSGVVLCTGGSYNQYQNYGLLLLSGYYAASYSNNFFGARLQYLP